MNDDRREDDPDAIAAGAVTPASLITSIFGLQHHL